ncbi:hypothetical protein JYG23_14650 [Sedimentibacter sp. zth1]|uniref:hypothetical protein n=1 Tax=Sedimentibacter sp. zth1 TaxID=2816908 RepID=UPI001A916375|nr:hypothetical protein [Sedimentibacter sp. zth1]QSX05881.1 hypothetical protein JYG23_14650 [Sedimentibacter sp. zth1]
MLKKILLSIFICLIILQTSCNYKDSQTIELTEEQQNLVLQFDQFNLEQKQIFNYLISDTYKYYNYLYFKRPVADSSVNKVLEFNSIFMDKGFKYFCFKYTNFMNRNDKYLCGLTIPEMNKEHQDNPDNKVEWVQYTEEDISIREKAYIKMLNKMYDEIDGFSKFSNVEKWFYAIGYNEIYKIKLCNSYYGGSIGEGKIKYLIDELEKNYGTDFTHINFANFDNKATIFYHTYEQKKIIVEESFERIYNNLLEDYKNFYDFLGDNVKSKGKDANRTYTFEEPGDYDFIEYLVCLYFDRADTFELYEYTFDDCGLVKTFTYKSIEEIIKNIEE